MQKIANPSRRRLFKGKVANVHTLRLPWAVNEQTFTNNCTQCGDCLAVCETSIIVKDDLGFPKIDFSNDECTFCMKCIDVCQQPLFIDAITKKTEKSQPESKPWPAEFVIEKNCFAKNSIYCQSCRDACDHQAITFHYENSSIPVPTLSTPDCVQCGACVSVCPTDAIKVIITEGNAHV